MTEAEIMKALECCCDRNITKCIRECPMKDFDGECLSAIKCDILALLNRKNAEIERLDKEYDRVFKENVRNQTEVERLKKYLDTECDSCACGLIEQRDKARAEAIKEFAERVTIHFGTYTDKDYLRVLDMFRLIDQIAKEMGCVE